MKDKVKEILYLSLMVTIIMLLGFAPVGQEKSFSFDWGNLKLQLIDAGVIDKEKAENLSLLNLLWGFGLSNKNPVLENGPMMDPRYGGAGNFASIGGWTLAQGNVMHHYSMHSFVTLTPQEQMLVERVAKNIYRPCCGNSTYFPDCNHGMAMLGLLELMAKDGRTEREMYEIAEEVNGYWFPNVATNCNT